MAVPAALRHRIFEKLVEKKLVIDVVLMWRTLSSSRYGGLAVTFMIVTTMSGLIEPASVSAAHHPTIRIQLSLVDTSIPGGFYLGDTLRLTVNVTINGRQARTGALYLDTTDRAEPNLCVVAFDPPHSNYCKIDFPNSGRWRIMAKYTLNNTWYTQPALRRDRDPCGDHPPNPHDDHFVRSTSHHDRRQLKLLQSGDSRSLFSSGVRDRHSKRRARCLSGWWWGDLHRRSGSGDLRNRRVGRCNIHRGPMYRRSSEHTAGESGYRHIHWHESRQQ
jgi:hypothetical protein